jgi:hypothetical protein
MLPTAEIQEIQETREIAGITAEVLAPQQQHLPIPPGPQTQPVLLGLPLPLPPARSIRVRTRMVVLVRKVLLEEIRELLSSHIGRDIETI